MLRRLLNIASIVCLVACVALAGLWVRSYYAIDSFSARFVGERGLVLSSKPGRLFTHLCTTIPPETPLWSFESDSDFHNWDKPMHESWGRSGLDAGVRLGFMGFPMPGGTSGGGHAFVLPYWFLVITTGSLAMLCQLRWPPRFTLRCLFIATTFLAVVLGMIAWLDRAWIGK
jgi:hypothetical protein